MKCQSFVHCQILCNDRLCSSMGNNSAVGFSDHVLLMLQVMNSHENCGMRNTVVQEDRDVTERDDIKENFHFSLVDFEVKYSQPLSLRKKLYEFYTAPITKFWGQAVSD